jgi:hypothetical protein
VSRDARTARIRRALREAVAGPDRVLAAREFDDLAAEYQRLQGFAAQYGYSDAETTQRIDLPIGGPR